MERQFREVKFENQDALKELAKIERKSARVRASQADQLAATEARVALKAVLDELAELLALLGPYEKLKENLAEARARYRELTNAFVDELRARCGALDQQGQRDLVLCLFAEDLQLSLSAAASEKRESVCAFIERLWDKYRVTLTDLLSQRRLLGDQLAELVEVLGYR